MSKLDDILHDADWTGAMEQSWTAKELIKDLFLEYAKEKQFQFMETPLMVLNVEEFMDWVNGL